MGFFVLLAKSKFTDCAFNILDNCTTSAVTTIPELHAFIIVFIEFIIRILRQCYNCGIRHVTVPIAARILIANVRHIGLSNICVINLVYFKMQV